MALPQKGHPCLTVFRLPQLLSINHKKGSLKPLLPVSGCLHGACRSNIRR